MLDNQARWREFGLDMASEQLAKLFSSDFAKQLELFSVNQAIFHLKEPQWGKLACAWLNNPNFSVVKSQRDFVEIGSDQQPLAEQPFYLKKWFVILTVLQLGGVDAIGALTELRPVFDQLQPTAPTSDNQAKILAKFTSGKIGLIISGQDYNPAGEWWQFCYQKYARSLCFWQNIEQLDLTAWTGRPVEKPFGVIDLISDFDSDQTKRLFSQKNRLLSGFMPASRTVKLTTSSPHSQILEMMLIAEMTSFYLALIYQQSLRTNHH